MRALKAAALAVSALVTLLVVSCAPAPKPVVLVYGDSLTFQSESAVHFLYDSKDTVIFRAYPGTAPCDWTAGLAKDKATYKPTRVVIAFTGNTQTDCVKTEWLDWQSRGAGDAGAVMNYERSLHTFNLIFYGTPTTVLGSLAMGPRLAGHNPFNGSPALNAMYARVSAQTGMRYSDAADRLLTPGHVFTAYGHEFVNGPIVRLRDPDNVHLLGDGAMWYAVALMS